MVALAATRWPSRGRGMLGAVDDDPDLPPDSSALAAPVTLVVGPEEFLAERAVAAVLSRARVLDPAVDVRRLAGPEVEPGALLELTSPSLFGDGTVLIIERAHELNSAAAEAVAELVRRPVDHVLLVLIHSGQSNRAKAVLEACRSTHAREIPCPKVARMSERVDFVRSEAKAARRRLADDAARALVDAVGSDLRELAAACAQLVADTEEAITPEVVARYYAGRADVTSFQVADLAVDGRTSEALGQLRHALGSGVAPVLVTSALAQALRSIGRVASAPRGARPADLARDLGMPPWKVDVVRRQVRGWTADGLADAITAVADADAAVKGAYGAGDPGYALEKALVTIGRVRTG
jgi:DNA polymerase-3 subunit delta